MHTAKLKFIFGGSPYFELRPKCHVNQNNLVFFLNIHYAHFASLLVMHEFYTTGIKFIYVSIRYTGDYFKVEEQKQMSNIS